MERNRLRSSFSDLNFFKPCKGKYKSKLERKSFRDIGVWDGGIQVITAAEH